MPQAAPVTPEEIVRFWIEETGPKLWYQPADALDAVIRERFRAAWQDAEAVTAPWLDHPQGTLAALILTDQFPRNMFRGDARSFATDPLARRIARFILYPPMPTKVRYLTPAQPAWFGIGVLAFALLPKWARRMYRLLAQRYPDAHCELDFADPYQLLVATVLSAQTTDVRVNGVTPALFARYPDPVALAAADRTAVHDHGTEPDPDAGADALRPAPTDPAPLTSDQLVSHLVTWLMKGLHA